ncbi:MAG: C-type lectin domain-containing protein, partial [Mycoplasmatales bacterium]|nr:C-type lectin domain-containing protein [Mycoplasmatales bacterium]
MYFKIFEIKGTWPQAEKRCRDRGGFLASVKTKKANDFIDQLTGK